MEQLVRQRQVERQVVKVERATHVTKIVEPHSSADSSDVVSYAHTIRNKKQNLDSQSLERLSAYLRRRAVIRSTLMKRAEAPVAKTRPGRLEEDLAEQLDNEEAGFGGLQTAMSLLVTAASSLPGNDTQLYRMSVAVAVFLLLLEEDKFALLQRSTKHRNERLFTPPVLIGYILQHMSQKKHVSKEECCICLSPAVHDEGEREDVFRSTCGCRANYHQECLRQWMTESSSAGLGLGHCRVCRNQLPAPPPPLLQ